MYELRNKIERLFRRLKDHCAIVLPGREPSFTFCGTTGKTNRIERQLVASPPSLGPVHPAIGAAAVASLPLQ